MILSTVAELSLLPPHSFFSSRVRATTFGSTTARKRERERDTRVRIFAIESYGLERSTLAAATDDDDIWRADVSSSRERA